MSKAHVQRMSLLFERVDQGMHATKAYNISSLSIINRIENWLISSKFIPFFHANISLTFSWGLVFDFSLELKKKKKKVFPLF